VIEQKYVIITNSDGQLESNSLIPIPINSTSLPEPILIRSTPTASPKPRLTSAAKPTTPTQPKSKPKPESVSTAAAPDSLAHEIEAYHKDAERRCLADYANHTHVENYYCLCLPTEFRTYKAQNFSLFGFIHSFIHSFIQFHSLRASSSLTLNVRRTRLSTVGDRAFPVAAARTWNSLPQHVTSAPSMSVFRSRLKAFLFRRSFPWHL